MKRSLHLDSPHSKGLVSNLKVITLRMLWETYFRWSSCSERNYHNPCLKITDKFIVVYSLQLVTKTRHETGQYFIVLKISPFSFYCFQDDEKEKIWKTWKKYAEKIRKKNQLEKNIKRKLKITQMQCRVMSFDIYFILYTDNLSKKRSTSLGL